MRSVVVTAVVFSLLAVSCGSTPAASTTEPSPTPATAAPSPTVPSTSTPYPMPTGAPLVWITPSPPVTCTAGSTSGSLKYQSGARTYSGSLFRPVGAGPFPAVMVLHSSIGLTDHELAYGQWLADQGYVALVTDYFAPVGVTPATLNLTTFPADVAREDLARAIDCLRSIAYVDKNRVGAVGFSMGGYFSLTLGTREDVRAVVAYYPGVCDAPADEACLARYSMATVAAQMRAPVLLLHGDADIVVPFALVRATQDILMRAGKTSELVPLVNVGHGFDFGTSRAGNSNYNPRAIADAQARTLAFLQATLH